MVTHIPPPPLLCGFQMFFVDLVVEILFSIEQEFYVIFTWVICAFLVVICAAGDFLANLLLAYFGIAFLERHCLLKYMLAQRLISLDLTFL